MSTKILIVLIPLILFGCQQEKNEWNPVFEETNFTYLTTSIDSSLSSIDEAYSGSEKGEENAVKENLHKAKRKLLAIKDYYIPLTVVRQKIYDADRYFKLNQIDETGKLLKASKEMITSLDVTTKNEIFDKVIIDLTSMIDEVIASLDEKTKQNTYDKMKILGEHVNMMLNRGDLVLSGIEFEK